MKSTIHELKNYTSKIISKKSILFLSSIVLLFLINACTLLPTGGPVSANRDYKVHNETFFALLSTPGLETLDFDLNDDGYRDLNVGTANSGYIYISGSSEVLLASTYQTIPNKLKDFSLSEPIDLSNNWNSNGAQLLYNYSGLSGQVITEPTPKPDGTVLLGIRYLKNGDFYFGWMKLYNDKKNQITVIESCFNTIPNQPILAGKK